jgi:hypothetical protein
VCNLVSVDLWKGLGEQPFASIHAKPIAGGVTVTIRNLGEMIRHQGVPGFSGSRVLFRKSFVLRKPTENRLWRRHSVVTANRPQGLPFGKAFANAIRQCLREL